MLNDQAYEAARRLIIEGRLAPGLRISEPELSAQLGLRTAAVRTALTRLAQENLVSPIPRKGYVISPLTMRGAEELMDIRFALEPRAAFLAAGRIDEAEVAALRPFFVTGYSVDDVDGLNLLLAKNSEFRKLIARASGNRRLATLVSGLVDEMERYLRLSWQIGNRSAALLRGFDDLVEALLAGQPRQAERIAADNLGLTFRNVRDALARRQEIREAQLVLAN